MAYYVVHGVHPSTPYAIHWPRHPVKRGSHARVQYTHTRTRRRPFIRTPNRSSAVAASAFATAIDRKLSAARGRPTQPDYVTRFAKKSVTCVNCLAGFSRPIWRLRADRPQGHRWFSPFCLVGCWRLPADTWFWNQIATGYRADFGSIIGIDRDGIVASCRPTICETLERERLRCKPANRSGGLSVVVVIKPSSGVDRR